MIKQNEFYIFAPLPKVKFQLVELGSFHVFIKNIITGKTHKITKESFEVNYKLAA